MLCHVSDEQKDLPIDHAGLLPLAEAVIALEKTRADEVSLWFVTNERICELHDQFFDDSTPTDCISFPMDGEHEEYRVLGEVFVCPNTAREYCDRQGGDVYGELTLYVVHGLLHLIGYDDIDPTDREKMRSAEKRHMNNLRDLGLLLRTS